MVKMIKDEGLKELEVFQKRVRRIFGLGRIDLTAYLKIQKMLADLKIYIHDELEEEGSNDVKKI